METHGINELLQILEAMRQVEIAMSLLYRICAKKWEEDSQFWLDLSKDEIKHSENVKTLARIINNRLDSEISFQSNRPFTINSAQSFTAGIMYTVQRVKDENISKKKILAIALDIERSALERKYSELVKTDDIEYQTISKTIDTETQIHRDRIEKKLKEYDTIENH